MPWLPDAIQIGPFPLALHVLMTALGGLLAYWLAGRFGQQENGMSEGPRDLIVNGLIGALAGAKLLSVLSDPAGHAANPAMLLFFPYSPLTVPVSIAGGMVGIAWGLRSRADRLTILDHASLPIAAGMTIASLGLKGLGAWAFAPLLGTATLIAWGMARLGRAPGHRFAQTVVLLSLALVLADLAHPASHMPGGVSYLQWGAALSGTIAWFSYR